jgi:anti-sigma B factor antagonist
VPEEAVEILEEIASSVTVLAPSGRFDTAGSRYFENHASRIIVSGHGGFVIDFSDVDHINSAGLRVLLHAAKSLKMTGRKIALCGLRESIMMIFEITGFSSVFEIYETRNAAIAAAS